MLSDTHPEAEKVHIGLIRKATVGERFAKMRALTSWVIGLSRRAVARANPHLGPEEMRLTFIELHYGKELADRVRRYLRNP